MRGLAHPFASLIPMRVPMPLSRSVRQGGGFDFPFPEEKLGTGRFPFFLTGNWGTFRP
jgi:hypothetical protein